MVFEKGNKHTKETIELMKKNHTRPWLDKTLTEKHKEKKRIAMKEWWIENKNNLKTLERNKKIGLKRKGILHTIEAKEKMSKAGLGRYVSDKTKEAIRKAQTGKIVSNETKKKMSKSRIGTHPSEITKNKLKLNAIERWKDEKYHKQFSESRKGKNNPNYQGGKSFEPYTLDFNKNFKKAIKERDGCCMLCNVGFEDLKLLKRKIHVHHIDYNKLNSFPQNCLSLCESCHTKSNYNRNQWIVFFQSLLKEKYNYKYSEDQKIIFDFDFEPMKGGITKC